MRLFPELTDEDELMLFERLSRPEREENVVMVYSEEGMFEVGHTIKKFVIQEGENFQGEAAGRRFKVDTTVFKKKEVWQLPVPNFRDPTSIAWFSTGHPGGWLLRESSGSGSVHYFVGETVDSAALWLNTFFEKK